MFHTSIHFFISRHAYLEFKFNNIVFKLYNLFLFLFRRVLSVSKLRKAKNAQYNSWISVSDMQVALQKVVDDEELIEDLKTSEYFSVICWRNLQTATLKRHLKWYVCYLKNSCSVTRFLSVIELSGGTAQCIFDCVKSVFNMYCISFDKWISVATFFLIYRRCL